MQRRGSKAKGQQFNRETADLITLSKPTTMPIGITLPNGRRVDVETKAGANYFISYGENFASLYLPLSFRADSHTHHRVSTGGPESFEFFSTNLERSNQIYRSISQRASRRPTQNEIHELTVVYGVAAGLAQNADPGKSLGIDTRFTTS